MRYAVCKLTSVSGMQTGGDVVIHHGARGLGDLWHLHGAGQQALLGRGAAGLVAGPVIAGAILTGKKRYAE